MESVDDGEEVQYWGAVPFSDEVEVEEAHFCKTHGPVPKIFVFVTFNGVVTKYPYCAFCWGEEMMKHHPIICNKELDENPYDRKTNI